MEAVTSDLGRRIEGLGGLPLEAMLAGGPNKDKAGKQALQVGSLAAAGAGFVDTTRRGP